MIQYIILLEGISDPYLIHLDPTSEMLEPSGSQVLTD